MTWVALLLVLLVSPAHAGMNYIFRRAAAVSTTLPATTTTSTTTSTTTTSLQSVRYLFTPSGTPELRVPATLNWPMIPAVNAMHCHPFVPIFNLLNATKIAWQVTQAGGGGSQCSVAIYSADGNTRLATTGATPCSSTGVITVTVAPFSLTAGTTYLQCATGNDLAIQFATMQQAHVLNATLGGVAGKALNLATVGAPPLTTGSISSWSYADFAIWVELWAGP